MALATLFIAAGRGIHSLASAAWTTCLLLVAGFLLTATSCNNAFIDPFDNGERYFTVYGYIDVLETEHTLRVIPVTRFPERITSPTSDQTSIDATVTSIDVLTGETTRWRHSLEKLDDGTYGHIYRATFLPQPGRTYQLTVLRSDGVMARATTHVPYFAETVPTPDTLFFPYEISPDGGPSRDVYVPDIPSPWDMIVTYDLQGRRVHLPYGRRGERTDTGGWRFTVDLAADAPRMREALGVPDDGPLPLLHAIELQIRVLDANWDPPAGVFDPEILNQPGTLSNVENGYGFWGAIGFYQYTWVAPPQL